MTFLSLRNIDKAYAGIPALRGASLAVEGGEIHALMGENGAGKSTLIKILAGVVAPDSAEIEVEGVPTTIDSAAAAHRLGFRFIHQELNVVPSLSVAENIFIGRRYPTRAGLLVDWRALARAAQAALERLGITHIDPRRTMADLSVGDRMLVRISSAFLGEDGAPARLYVMDEPTAALTGEEAERLFAVLREIRAAGGAVLYVSHRIDEVVALCDRATVLRDGRTVDTGEMAAITHDHLVALMIGRKVEEAYPRPAAAVRAERALVVENLRAGAAGPLSFSVAQGEILGIAGLAGAGQRELLRALYGDLPLEAGTMTLHGKPYRPSGPRAALAAGLAYVPRERRSEGLVLSRPIFENVTLPHLGHESLGGVWLKAGHERKLATRLGADVRLKASGPGQVVRELSGGNQQKVVFAKALAGNPRVLLLDEPTRGVDIGARYDIYALLRRMAAESLAVVLASSDLPELLGMADRIAVMRDGAITTIVAAAGLTEHDLMNLCYTRPASDGRPAGTAPQPAGAGR